MLCVCICLHVFSALEYTNIVLAFVNKYLYLYFYTENSVIFSFLGEGWAGSYLDGVLNLIFLNFGGVLIQRGGIFFLKEGIKLI